MSESSSIADSVLQAAAVLREATNRLAFAPPVAFVYNPLDYAWRGQEAFVRRYAGGRKRVLFLGMNPGPFGMAQTGVPFGEVAAVRDWLGITAPVARPAREHPKRMITGFDCARSEVSGRRLWGLFADRFGTPAKFFETHFVLNYCPLVFMEASGANRTPDKLPSAEKAALFRACDQHLCAVAAAFEAEWIIGVGQFAATRASEAFPRGGPKIGRILHPSPASPAANRDWAGVVAKELRAHGVWQS